MSRTKKTQVEVRNGVTAEITLDPKQLRLEKLTPKERDGLGRELAGKIRLLAELERARREAAKEAGEEITATRKEITDLAELLETAGDAEEHEG